MTNGTEERRIAWVTGAGGGMGRASAVRLAASGYTVALSGRRMDALADTGDLVEDAGAEAMLVPLDVSDADAVEDAAVRIGDALGPITAVVASAGLNTPQRYWRDQEVEQFSSIVSTNLIGAAVTAGAVLPGMRAAGGGSVVFISSYSGWRFSPDAGVAYSASKTALSSLAESLNAQENQFGIRATNLCPGDVDSDFLRLRPVVPDATARTSMLSPDDVAAAVQFIVDSPAHVCVNELVISPVKKGVLR